MKHLSSFKLFEGNNNFYPDIDLFEDLLQEYFDKYKLYPFGYEVTDSKEVNGWYSIRDVSSKYFKVIGFKDMSSGILIQITLVKHNNIREYLSKDLTKFVRRIEKMGYSTEIKYDDSFTPVFYIEVLDKEEKETLSESIKYINANFEVSEGEFDKFERSHKYNTEGMNTREKAELNSLAKSQNLVEKHYFNSSVITLKGQDLRIDISKWEDDWYGLFIEEPFFEEYFYLFPTWEDLIGVIDDYFNFIKNDSIKYIDFYGDNKAIVESISENEELCKTLTEAEYYNFWNAHELKKMTEDDIEKIATILQNVCNEIRVSDDPYYKNRDYEIIAVDDNANLEITITKFDDSWYLVYVVRTNSWNDDVQFYLCDEVDSIKYIDLYY